MPRMPFFTEETRKAAREAVRVALAEDLGEAGDITSSAIVSKDLKARGSYVYNEDAIVAGVRVVEEVCRQVSKGILIEILKGDAEQITRGQTALRVYGPARALLAAERTSLNFLSHLSGVATLTRKFVNDVAGTKAAIFDTRKSLPGLRVLEKFAVRCGGGVNHRMGLYDQVLVKDNHLAMLRWSLGGRSMVEALAAARKAAGGGVLFEVEATTLEEVEAAVAAGADIVMLDNMKIAAVRKVVEWVAGRAGKRPILEVSGGVTTRNVSRIAATGVDRISVGALTHSAPSIDISMELQSE